MLVACIWDRWSRSGSPDLYSFAAITDEPTPEVAATGHQRTVITIQEPNLAAWFSPSRLSKEQLERILSEKETPCYVHQIAA
jgi:putative SOS response-associated peptidase YedK